MKPSPPGLSPESIEAARLRTQADITKLNSRREEFLASLAATVSNHSNVPEGSRIEELAERLSKLQVEQDELLSAQSRTEARLSEMVDYRSSIQDERDRMERAKQAGVVLADLKVTHCPACDRALQSTNHNGEVCHLCQRPFDSSQSNLSRADRIELEMQQLHATLTEADEIIVAIRSEVERIAGQIAKDRSQIAMLRNMLRPIRTAAAAVLPPEIGVLDMEIGQLQERLSQIDRIAQSLSYRDVLATQIETIQSEVAQLESDVAAQSATLDFERASDQLADGMNTYLNLIHQKSPASWTQKEIRVRLDEKRFRFLVGDKKWNSQLGGTLSLFFLISYHYALMRLSTAESCHFPGLIVLDFPAVLEDGSSVADKENFVLEPFIELLETETYSGCQVIATGNSFENLVGAHRIDFKRIWK